MALSLKNIIYSEARRSKEIVVTIDIAQELHKTKVDPKRSQVFTFNEAYTEAKIILT